MTQQLRLTRLTIIGATILCLMIAACSRKRAWTGPKFNGRLLVLAKDWDLRSDLIDITPGADSTYNYNVITSNVFSAAASPDQKWLLYSKREGVFLRDLRGGVDKQIAPYAGGSNRCLAWSTDSKRFSFRSSESHQRAAKSNLYVSDLDGNTKVVWEGWVGGVPSDCDVFWSAPDRLIFDRVRGHTPQQQEAGEVLLVNTATVAILGDLVKFVDTEKAWSVEGICPFGNAAVVSRAFKSYPLFIANGLNDLGSLKPSQACAYCEFAGFTPKSCVPFFLSSDSKGGTYVFSLNPTDWKQQKRALINRDIGVIARTMISSSAKLMVVGDGQWLFLVDTESGNLEQFFPKSFSSILNKRIISVEPIVWFEN